MAVDLTDSAQQLTDGGPRRDAILDHLADGMAKHRAVLPASLTTVDGREVVVERLNPTTARIGQYVFDNVNTLDASIALAHAAQPRPAVTP